VKLPDAPGVATIELREAPRVRSYQFQRSAWPAGSYLAEGLPASSATAPANGAQKESVLR